MASSQNLITDTATRANGPNRYCSIFGCHIGADALCAFATSVWIRRDAGTNGNFGSLGYATNHRFAVRGSRFAEPPSPRISYSGKYQGDAGFVVLDAKDISSVVAMVPLDNEDTGHYFVTEKLGLDVAFMGGMEEDLGDNALGDNDDM